MSIIKTIARNTLVLLAGQVITVVLTYFYTIYTARYLGAEDFGILSFAIAFTGISCLLADLGLSIFITREVSRNNLLASKYVGNVLVIKTILTIITIGFTATVINLLGYPPKTVMVVYLITLSTIFTSFTNMFNSIFQAFQKMEYISTGRILYSILMFAGILVTIHKNMDIIFFASVYFFVSLIALGYSFYICVRKFIIPKIELDFKFWKYLLKESIPFWMTSVFVIIYFRMDMIMLSIMKGDEAVGWYAASYRLIDGLSIIPSILMSVMFPVFSKCYVDSKNSLELAFKKSFKFLIIISIPIGVGITILADEIIMLFYGGEYLPSVAALKILIWASVLSFINCTPSMLLNSTNKQRYLMTVTFIGATLNTLLNYMLIPSLSYEGAGISTVTTEFIVGLLILYKIQKTQDLRFQIFDVIFRSSISAIIMGIFVLIFKNYTLFLIIPFASLLYFIGLYILNGLEQDDINLLKELLRR